MRSEIGAGRTAGNSALNPTAGRFNFFAFILSAAKNPGFVHQSVSDRVDSSLLRMTLSAWRAETNPP
jgi:hypothetical protein